jgi:purine-binding chemotaxis protein CheW
MSEISQRSDADILRERAERLARSRADTSLIASDAAKDRYLIAACGRERFAIALESVAEVFRPTSVTPLPRARAPLWGVTSWRGHILPVIVFGQCVPGAERGVVITLTVGSRTIAGLWADEVEGEEAIAGEEIHPAGASAESHAGLVTGVTSDATSILDAQLLARSLDERVKAGVTGTATTP